MATIQHRRNVQAAWENVNPTLAAGELGLEIGLDGLPTRFKLGNGISPWAELPYFSNMDLLQSVDVDSISNATTIGKNLLLAESQALARAAIGAQSLVSFNNYVVANNAAIEELYGLTEIQPSKDRSLRDLMLPRSTIGPVASDVTSFSTTSTLPTFTNMTYAAGGQNLKNYAQFLGGSYEFLYSSYWQNTGLTPNSSPAGALGFITDASHIALQHTSFGAGDVQIYVDGRPVHLRSDAHQIAYGSQIYTDLVLSGTRRFREIEFASGMPAFTALLFEQTDTVFPSAKKNLKVAIVGDSYIQGSMAEDKDNVLGLTQLAQVERLRMLTGWDILAAGIGGSGYLAGGTNGSSLNYGAPDRINGLKNYQPDLIVAYGSINDNGFTEAEITAAAIAYYAKLHNELPGIPVVVVGAEPYNVGFEAYDKIERAILAAVNTNPPNVSDYVNLRGMSWFNGSGRVGTPTNDGNSDRMLSADGLHPSNEGMDMLAIRLKTLLGRAKVPLG